MRRCHRRRLITDVHNLLQQSPQSLELCKSKLKSCITEQNIKSFTKHRK